MFMISYKPLEYFPIYMNPPKHQRCVSLIAINPAADEILLVRKTQGPAHLIGKLTFPGGKVDAGDLSPAHAACRQAIEEGGLVLRPQDLVHLMYRGDHSFRLDVFVAVADLSQAGPQPNECEPVFRASWSKTRQGVLEHPLDYAQGTAALLRSVEGVVELRRRLSLGSKQPSVNSGSPQWLARREPAEPGRIQFLPT